MIRLITSSPWIAAQAAEGDGHEIDTDTGETTC